MPPACRGSATAGGHRPATRPCSRSRPAPWRPPLTDDERAYIERRTQAIRDLAALLVRSSRAWQRARLRDGADVTADARRRAAAVAKAREELESTTGVGAVDEIERLRSRIRTDTPVDEDAGDVS
jgi:hypothetical protein